jgi:hypothetical protein
MSDLRQTLREMGEELEPDPSLPSPVRTRVRRRQAVTAFLAVMALTGVGLGSAAGIRALSERASRVPTNRVTLPPAPASPVACTDGWHLAPNPGVPGDHLDTLVAASAVTTDDIWAVGARYVTQDSASPTEALFEHWDGRKWTVAPGADLGGRAARLNAVAAIAPNDVWAVGRYEDHGQTLIERWDGVRWSTVPGPAIAVGQPPNTGRSLDSIAVISATDIWILGHFIPGINVPGIGGESVSRDVFEHWDGRRWTIVPSPQDESTTGTSAMQDLSAVASNDVWAVGGRVNGFGEVGRAGGALVEHWDGRTWSGVTSPLGDAPLTQVGALNSRDAWALAGGDFTTVGSYGGFGPLRVLHWDGHSWATSLHPPIGDDINAITAVASTDVWAVGTRQGQPLIEHWDGKRWTVPGDSDGNFRPPSDYAPPPSITHTLMGDVVVFSAEPDPAGPPQNRLWFRCGGASS